jgi:hypothetical protein
LRPLSRTGAAVLATAASVITLGLPVAAASAAVPAAARSRPATVPHGVSAHEWSRVRALAPALHVLRMCESGGRYALASGNGYYGAYQFLPATWHSLGYHGLPNHAAPAVQDAAAVRLHDRRGSWADWGSCGHRAARAGRA